MPIDTLREEIQDALKSELSALEDDMLPQEYREPTYKLDPDAEHNPPPATETAHAQMEKVTKA